MKKKSDVSFRVLYVLYVCVGVCMYVCMYVCTCQSAIAIVFNEQGDFGDDTRYIRIDNEMK